MGFGNNFTTTTGEQTLSPEELLQRRQEVVASRRLAQAESMGITSEPKTPDVEELKKETSSSKKTEDKESVPKKETNSSKKQENTGSDTVKSTGQKNQRSQKKKTTENEDPKNVRITKTIRITKRAESLLDIYCLRLSSSGEKITPGELLEELLMKDIKKNAPMLFELVDSWNDN